MKKTILLSARDTAAAQIVCILKPLFDKEKWCQTILIAGSPADKIFISHKIDFISCPQWKHETEALAYCEKIIQKFTPDAILTGSSGPGFGVDEYLIFCANVPSFTIQDFWGFLNPYSGQYADTYFVLDKYAEKQTKSVLRHKKVLPIGSVKHSSIVTRDWVSIRTAKRRAIKLSSNLDLLIGFFDQPLKLDEGYKTLCSDFAASITQLEQSFKLLLRFHPGTPRQTRNVVYDIFRRKGVEIILDNNESNVYETISACDIVVSSFSTCNLDNIYMNASSSAPLGVSVYLFYNEEIRNSFEKHHATKMLPSFSHNEAYVIYKKSEILQTIHKAINSRMQSWVAVKKLPSPLYAPKKIIDVLKNQLQRGSEIG
ncbi:hypothetical protein [Terasakiella sp. SH-1]|uniref:hypothetical protein n=1 Tax=Terasakiella sp. SH-1 TaxID=2560057 RepID=UPI00107316DF|nr:hypothetical protein [Terasakiella sp. SH-1]